MKMTNLKLLLLITIALIFIKCSVGTSNTPKGYEQQRKDSDKIDSVIKAYCTSVYKLNIDSSGLNLTLGLKEEDTKHFRKRSFFVDRLMYEMRDYLDSIHKATVKVTNINDFLKPIDTYTFDNTKLRALKNWGNNDPIYLYFMSLAAGMDNEKYEEFASIARSFSAEFEDEKKLNTFDPDLAYYLDKFVSEMYGEPKGGRQRVIMEAFYEATFDPQINAKYIKPTDILQFTNYADSVYYLKEYPSEMKTILGRRLKPNK